MSDRPNRWMLQLPEAVDLGVDTASGCNCHCLCLWFLSVACVSQWICNDRVGFWIGPGGRQVSRPLGGVEVTHWVISATPELLGEDEGVEFCPSIVEATELPPWEVSLSPAGAETGLLAGGSWEFPKGQSICCSWTIHTTGVVPGWRLWESIVRYRSSTIRLKRQFPLHAYWTAGMVNSYLSNLGGI